jgi:hypothetical protein
MFGRWSSLVAVSTLLVVCAPQATAQMGEPFDAVSLDNALKGMRVYKARMTDIVALRVQYLNVQNRRSEAADKGARDVEVYQENQNKFRDCLHEKLQAGMGRKVQEKMMSISNNPAAIQKYTDALNAASAAAAKGDTAALARANADMMKAIGIDFKADTVAATATCGGAPKRPASIVEIEQLDRQSDSLAIRVRRAETAADGDASRAASVAPSRFAEMRERLTNYANRPGSFQGKEADLLAAHKAEIVALTKVQ